MPWQVETAFYAAGRFYEKGSYIPDGKRKPFINRFSRRGYLKFVESEPQSAIPQNQPAKAEAIKKRGRPPKKK